MVVYILRRRSASELLSIDALDALRFGSGEILEYKLRYIRRQSSECDRFIDFGHYRNVERFE